MFPQQQQQQQQQRATVTATPIMGEESEIFHAGINKKTTMEDSTEKTACCESDDEQGEEVQDVTITKIPMMMGETEEDGQQMLYHGLIFLFLFIGTTLVSNFVVGMIIALSYTSLSYDKLVDFYIEVSANHTLVCLSLFVGTTLLSNFVVGTMVATSYTSLSTDKFADFFSELTDSTTNTEQEEETTKVNNKNESLLSKIWVGLYRSVPVVYFPFTQLDVSFTIASALFLYGVRTSLKMIMMSRLVGWERHQQLNDPTVDPQVELDSFLGYAVAAVHSMSLVPGAIAALRQLPDWTVTAPMNVLRERPHTQDLIQAMLQFCTGYMVYDSLCSEFDPLVLCHHLIATVYMTQCRVLGAGHTSALLCMVLGEITNPFQNGYSAIGHIITNGCCNGPMMLQLHKFLELAWAYSFFGARAIVLPLGLFPFVIYGFFIAETRKNVHLGNRILWTVLILFIGLGGYDYVLQCWELITTTNTNN